MRTRSSATADEPRDMMCQSKSCQLLHNSVETTHTTNPGQIKVMELEGYSRPMYNSVLCILLLSRVMDYNYNYLGLYTHTHTHTHTTV